MQYPLELLAPARDLAIGLAAIDHGADAVYIGAPRFGARSAAGNSLADIEKLVRHAHRFSARVYIALNTLLTDREIEDAVPLIHRLYASGVDALIIQDMGLLECDLPPIPLHASTQCDNRTAEKVRFLEDVGFQQVVLARELSLAEIAEIRAATTVALECFVHGALCVSYSGQCYMSEMVSGRSANRGECAQFCRHRYTLRDGNGRVLARDRHLLSLKDLDRSAHLRQMVAAGVSSFKIEGRLKDINYVKNITAFYRLLLDRLIEDDPNRTAASSGHCRFDFTPDPAKSYNRGRTAYFLTEARELPGSPDTPKSLGEEIGPVTNSKKKEFTLATSVELHNGDGLCYFSKSPTVGADSETGKTLVGLKANRVEGRTVFHRQTASPPVGAVVYRNHDTAFIKQLGQSCQCRHLTVDIRITETATGLKCELQDEDGCHSRVEMAVDRQKARNPGTIRGMIERQLRKSGGSAIEVDRVRVEVDDDLYIGAAVINALRRTAFAAHFEQRLREYHRSEAEVVATATPWLSNRVTVLDNIANEKAKAFYRRHGVTCFNLPLGGPIAERDLPLMTTKYCLAAQLRLCPKHGSGLAPPTGPFTLSDQTGVYTLTFDCGRCGMSIRGGLKKRTGKK